MKPRSDFVRIGGFFAGVSLGICFTGCSSEPAASLPDGQTAEVASVEADRQPSYVTSTADPVSARGEIVGLLRHIDPRRDAVGPPWIQDGDTVVSPLFPRCLLQIRYSPPAAYRWTVVAERTVGSDSLNLVFTVGGQRTMVVLDGYDGQTSGLDLLDGLRANENETTRHGTIFQQQRPHVIVCTVTPSSVQVTCDGTTVI